MQCSPGNLKKSFPRQSFQLHHLQQDFAEEDSSGIDRIEAAWITFLRDWREGEQSEPWLSLVLPSQGSQGAETPAVPRKIGQ